MTKPKPRGKRSPESWRELLFQRNLPLETETTQFLLVSVLDYLMTYVLLYYGHLAGSPLQHAIIESNPVARYFIHHWGLIKGLLGFKLGIVLMVCLITQIIARRRLQTAAFVLNLGTALTALVVLYSLWLFVSTLR